MSHDELLSVNFKRYTHDASIAQLLRMLELIGAELAARALGGAHDCAVAAARLRAHLPARVTSGTHRPQ